jgi:hypothetical protein
MLKKLAVPFLALVISTLGACSSDSPAGGTGGKSGSGGSGSGGSGSGGSGSGGSGSGGSAVVDAPVDMPAETAAETATETATETAAEVALPACTVTTDAVATEKLSAEDFCANFIAACGDVAAVAAGSPYKVMTTCITSYNASTKQHCQSYHLCGNSVGKTADAKAMHCPHATGMGPCVP